MKFLFAFSLAFGLSGSAFAVPAPKDSAPLLLYVSGTPGNTQIYAVKLDGTEAKALTDEKANNLFPNWSPDGRKIAFSSDRDGVQQIYVMDADGKNVSRLTKGNQTSRSPIWSPDGKKIAYTCHVGGNFPNIFVMDATGDNPVNLTKGQNFDGDPTWSPDGKQIAFGGTRGGIAGFRLHVVDADGKNMKALTRKGNPMGFVYPAWSPDGKKIAYGDLGTNQALELHLIDSDGKNARQLTKLGSKTGYPVWSPNGKQIAFYNIKNGVGTIQVIDADGGDPKVILDNIKIPEDGGRISWRR